MSVRSIGVAAMACVSLAAVVLAGCSDDKKTVSATVAGSKIEASKNATVEAKLNGQPVSLSGPYVCAATGGDINIAAGPLTSKTDATVLAAVGQADLKPSLVAFTNTASGPSFTLKEEDGGSASVKKDGEKITISGTLVNLEGTGKAPFEITATCPGL